MTTTNLQFYINNLLHWNRIGQIRPLYIYIYVYICTWLKCWHRCDAVLIKNGLSAPSSISIDHGARMRWALWSSVWARHLGPKRTNAEGFFPSWHHFRLHFVWVLKQFWSLSWNSNRQILEILWKNTKMFCQNSDLFMGSKHKFLSQYAFFQTNFTAFPSKGYVSHVYIFLHT